MFKGKFKDTLESWIKYRNYYCSLYSLTFSEYDGSSQDFHQAECIMKMTKRHAEDIESIWKTSISKFEETNDISSNKS